jgi:hypothetical protein
LASSQGDLKLFFLADIVHGQTGGPYAIQYSSIAIEKPGKMHVMFGVLDWTRHLCMAEEICFKIWNRRQKVKPPSLSLPLQSSTADA